MNFGMKKLLLVASIFMVSSASANMGAYQTGGFQMPPGSLEAVNPGGAQYARPSGPGEQPAYIQSAAGVNCIPRGYASPIEGPIANGAPVMMAPGQNHSY